MAKAVFLDRDGCLNKDPGYVHKVEDFELLPGVIEGLKKLSKDFIFVIITNQSGIGRKIHTEEDMNKFNEKLINELKKEGIGIKKIYHCPHHPDEKCNCRKPSTKYINQAAKEFGISIKQSWVIGDNPHDIEMGITAGCKSIYLTTGHGEKHINELEKNSIKPDLIAKNFMEAAEFIIHNKIKMPKQKIISKNEIKGIVESLKKQNKKIVTTNGVFDILHIGHIRYLQEAKKLGDTLIIAVNSDSSVKQIKGPKRPLNSENDRAEALASLECVDYVTIFGEETPVNILSKIKPDIHVKGGDYKISQIIEKDVVEKNNGRIILVPEVKGYSTTDLIKKIVGLNKN